jgi:hypothetical protein
MQVQLQGLTGLIQFDTSGYRSDVQLEVIQLSPTVRRQLDSISIHLRKFESQVIAGGKFCYTVLRALTKSACGTPNL